MTRAYQTLPSFQGDHQSAKMFSLTSDGVAGVSRMLFESGSMTLGSPTLLVSAIPFFFASDVGLHITVQGSGASGATLVGTVVTFTDATHVTLSVSASTAVSAATVFIGLDETSVITHTLLPPGSDGSGLARLIPLGNYLVSSGSLSIPNPQSGSLFGQSPRFGSVLVNLTPSSTSPVLQLGNGTNEPNNYNLEKLAIDANGAGSLGALYFTRVNLMAIRDVTIQGLGSSAIGITNPAAELLFGEMIFDHVSIYGVDGFIPSGSIGARLYATGNIDFHSSNIEQVYTGLILTGGSQIKFLWHGGHFERIGDYALWLANCQPDISAELAVGAVWLGNDVINGSINISSTSDQWTGGAVVDNGFGNRIRKTGSAPLTPGSHASFAGSITFDGDEWLSVPGVVSDPTFSSGVASWTASGATLATSAISMPGVHRGSSLMITDSGSGGGSASQTFTAATNTDYLLQVGILTKGSDAYRITVQNSTTTIYDSGSFTHPIFGENSDQQAFVVYRKRVPVTTDPVFTVTLYSQHASQVTTIPLVLISASLIQMAGNYTTAGTGFSTSGSGSGLVFTQNTSTGSVFSFKTQATNQRCFARFVATVPANVTAFVGVGGDGNATTACPQIPLRQGVTAEYTIPLASFPTNSILDLYSFSGGGSVQISELGIYPIADTDLAPYVLQAPYTMMPNALALTSGILPLGSAASAFQTFIQTSPAAGNSFKRVIYASNIQWDQTAGNWDVNANGGGDWAALVMLNGGDIALACESGLTLPTTRTDAQFNAAIKAYFKVTEFVAGVGQFILQDGSLQCPIIFGSGSPQSVVAAPIGAFYIDPTGASGNVIWWKQTGGAGNTGWATPATSGAGPVGAAGGDLTGTYPNPVLINSGVTAATYGDGTHVAQVVLDAKGRVLYASNVAIATGVTSIDSQTGAVTTTTTNSGAGGPQLSGSAGGGVINFTLTQPGASTPYSGTISIGGLTSASVSSANYLLNGKQCFVRLKFSGVGAGTPPTFTLPFNSVSGDQWIQLVATENGSNNGVWYFTTATGGTTATGYTNALSSQNYVYDGMFVYETT